MKVNEIFESIQGEGKYAGFPVLFIRLSGCTRKCNFCDTKYHEENEKMDIGQIVNIIRKNKQKIIVWTGGEPLLQLKEIKDVISLTPEKIHHIETNGDLIKNNCQAKRLTDIFTYVCISPKNLKITKNINNYFSDCLLMQYDIKIVTDLELNKNMIKYATMLMPLTVDGDFVWNDDMHKLGIRKYNQQIEQEVWNYCVEHNINFCLRQHVHVWDKKRGI